LPLGALIAVVLAVTTGQGARAIVIGLIVATILACACAIMVARQTRLQHQLAASST
jgi:hypothetical protein